jgi:hypothetical protein
LKPADYEHRARPTIGADRRHSQPVRRLQPAANELDSWVASCGLLIEDIPIPTGTDITPAARIRVITTPSQYRRRGRESRGRRAEGALPEHRDPIPFGFKTPTHLVEAVARAMHDGHNGYTPSPGILPAREAVAAEYERRGMPVSVDRVILTSGTSEGIELALGALADAGDEVLVPTPTYPLYTAVLAKLGARAVYYRTDPARGWLPDLDDVKRLISTNARAGAHRSEQPDRRRLPGRPGAR